MELTEVGTPYLHQEHLAEELELLSGTPVISEGQDIIEMETDKATVPVPSSVAGTVAKIVVSEGDTVPLGVALIVASGIWACWEALN